MGELVSTCFDYVSCSRIDVVCTFYDEEPNLYESWQAAFMASLHDPQLRDYYQRKRAAGKAHGTTIGAINRKLLH